MADHRQNVVFTPLMDLITPHVQGDVLTYDFSNFDRWIETFRRAGVVGYIEGSHLLGRAGSYDAAVTVPTRYFNSCRTRSVLLGIPPSSPSSRFAFF